MRRWIKEVRKQLIEKEVSREDLAKAVGLSTQTIHAYLGEFSKPPLTSVMAINQCLDISVGYDDE